MGVGRHASRAGTLGPVTLGRSPPASPPARTRRWAVRRRDP
jgi:hypothetical protein